MDVHIPGLNIHTALLRQDPIVLHKASLRTELQRKREESACKDEYLNQMVLDNTEICKLEVDINWFVREKGCPLDHALSIVLSKKGLDYWKQYDTLSAGIPSKGKPSATNESDKALPRGVMMGLLSLRPGSVGAQHPLKVDAKPVTAVTTDVASRFTPIDGQSSTHVSPPSQPDSISIGDVPSVRGRKVLKSGPRQSKRLLPHEPDAEGSARRPHHERFCWNLAYWLQNRINKIDFKRNFRELEDFATDLLLPRLSGNTNELKSTEEECIRSSGISMPEYRSLRARIIIGCAMIYEHNARGTRLNELTKEHIACRPNKNEKFRPSNIGRSQAQLLGHGSDVKKASLVYEECVKAGYIPDFSDKCMQNAQTNGTTYCAKQIVEECFPERARRRLYRDLEDWYAGYRFEGNEIPLNLRFVISESDL